MKKVAVTLSVLLTIGVTLLGIGINLLRQGEYMIGAVCIAVGFGVICLGVYLFELGLIDKFKQFVEDEKSEPGKE